MIKRFAILLLLAGCGPKGKVELRNLEGPQLAGLIQAEAGKTVLVNVWATWCGPCVSEMPALRRLQKEEAADKFKLILLSVDDPDAAPHVAEFLFARGFEGPAYIKAGKDQDFLKAMDPRWTGAIPLSLLYDGEGKLVDLWEGSRSHEDLKAALQGAMEEKS